MAEKAHDPLVGVGHGGDTWENLALHHKKVISAEKHERLLEQPGELAALEGKVYIVTSSVTATSFQRVISHRSILISQEFNFLHV